MSRSPRRSGRGTDGDGATSGARAARDRESARPGGSRTDDEEFRQGIPDARTLFAEVLGTFALTGVGAMAGVMGALTGSDVGTLAKAVAPGLLVMAFIYALGDASGAHFNPAVTLGFALKRVFPVHWVPSYWLAQLAGALLAALMLAAMFGGDVAAGTTNPHVATATAVAIETFLSLLLLTVILGTADRYRIVGANAALAVGGTIALCGLIAEPLTGASMNPARSLGPAIVAGRLSDAWIYVAGPILGMLVAVAATTLVHGARRDHTKVEAATGKNG